MLDRGRGANGHVKRHRFWTAVHRYLGLTIALFLASAAITGVILSFDEHLDAMINADLFRTSSRQSISPIEIARRLEAMRPDVRVRSFPLRVASGDNLWATVAPRAGSPPLGFDQVFLDAKGHVVGARLIGPGWDRRHLMAGVYAFHSTLLAGKVGRWLMGVVALGWFVSNLVGLYLTFPWRGSFWREWWRSWRLRFTGPAPRLILNLHRASGLWVLIGVSVLAFTSVSLNFYDEAFLPIVTRISPFRPSPFDQPAPSVILEPRLSAADAVGIAVAESRRRGFRRLPAKVSYNQDDAAYRILFTDDGFENYHLLGPVSLFVDGRSGKILHEDDPYHDSTGRKLARALYPLHTGQIAGYVGIAVIAILGLTTVETCGTGAYLWWKRRRTRTPVSGAFSRNRA